MLHGEKTDILTLLANKVLVSMTDVSNVSQFFFDLT
jgi:hypothetical protein